MATKRNLRAWGRSPGLLVLSGAAAIGASGGAAIGGSTPRGSRFEEAFVDLGPIGKVIPRGPPFAPYIVNDRAQSARIAFSDQAFDQPAGHPV